MDMNDTYTTLLIELRGWRAIFDRAGVHHTPLVAAALKSTIAAIAEADEIEVAFDAKHPAMDDAQVRETVAYATEGKQRLAEIAKISQQVAMLHEDTVAGRTLNIICIKALAGLGNPSAARLQELVPVLTPDSFGGDPSCVRRDGGGRQFNPGGR